MKKVIAPCLPRIGQRSVAGYRLEDEEEMVDSSRPEKVPHGDAPPGSAIFQRLATMCQGNRSTPKGLTGGSLTTLQIAELQLERLTGIDLKADAAKELEMGFFQLHFGTSFLIGNWLVRPHAFGGRPNRAVATSPRRSASLALPCHGTPRQFCHSLSRNHLRSSSPEPPSTRHGSRSSFAHAARAACPACGLPSSSLAPCYLQRVALPCSSTPTRRGCGS